MDKEWKIQSFDVKDIRFPTSLEKHGSDAVNIDPDYSCAYVTLLCDNDVQGYGLTFTLGRGNDIVCQTAKVYCQHLVGRQLCDIYGNFAQVWTELTQEPQLRWLGPEKGVTHIALASVINALWDLWARIENKPLWKLLVDMEPEILVSVIDFRYITDAITKEEAIAILKKAQAGKEKREADIKQSGYPAYTTSAGWLGYTDERVQRLCKEALSQGFTRFKVKVGANQQDDIHRVQLVRNEIGKDKLLMTDANQRWGVQEAIDWMKPLAPYNVLWIEEPTSPDDILGHAAIAKALEPLGIGVATGEACQNRVMFKQFLQAKALHYCQIDSTRIAGPNEILAVYLMAKKFEVPVCPHAGGVGLCEYVQHLQIFDYVSLSGTMENRMIEYVDHLHEHFTDPVIVKNGSYIVPTMPGYSAEMKPESLLAYEYPCGSEWQKLFNEGKFIRPK